MHIRLLVVGKPGRGPESELVERYAKVDQERIREALSRVKLPALNPAIEYAVSTPIAFERKAALAK